MDPPGDGLPVPGSGAGEGSFGRWLRGGTDAEGVAAGDDVSIGGEDAPDDAIGARLTRLDANSNQRRVSLIDAGVAPVDSPAARGNDSQGVGPQLDRLRELDAYLRRRLGDNLIESWFGPNDRRVS
jgi:hypothetical protein